MTTRPAPWRNLDNQDDRKIAHLAAIARNDTIHGGARAMVIARQCSKWDAAAIVADVYRLSTGKHSRHYEAWECPDCGAVHLGMDNAEECCAFSDDDTPSGDLEMAYAENDGDCRSGPVKLGEPATVCRDCGKVFPSWYAMDSERHDLKAEYL